MSIEEQIRAFHEIGKQIDALERQKKALGAAIMLQMQGKSMQVADYLVRRYSRLAIKTSLEEARAIDAVKLEETVDKDKIKALILLGKSVQGVTQTEYLRISLAKDKMSQPAS